MVRAIADTHTVIWYIFADQRLSETARSAIEEIAASGDQIGFSAITLAEIVYLGEKERVYPATLDRPLAAIESEDALLVEIPFDRHVAKALRKVDRQQVPDLPDRIIAATALYLNVPLISRDRKIQLSDVNTIW
ncbi:MAG TPA: type II toxin-antitoxin system VapC family toxin [Caldilineae bacterium]|nr:type II toxin-antitoxin system VapC family toxin [Caldilineae bacterium]